MGFITLTNPFKAFLSDSIRSSRPLFRPIIVANSSKEILPSESFFSSSSNACTSFIVYPAASNSASDIPFSFLPYSVIDSDKISEVIQPCFKVSWKVVSSFIILDRSTPCFFATSVTRSSKPAASVIPSLSNCFQPVDSAPESKSFRLSADLPMIPPKVSLISVRRSLASPKSPTMISQVFVQPD